MQGARRPHELAVTQARSKLEQQTQELAAQGEKAATAAIERETVSQTLATGQTKLAELTAAVAGLAQQEQAWHDARETLQRLESKRQLLTQELGQLQASSRRVQQMVAEKTAVSRNAQQAEQELAELTAQAAAITERNMQHSSKLGEKHNLEGDQSRLKEEMNRHKERIDGLNVESGGQCPLCGQPLSEDHRRKVLAQLQTEGEAMGERFRTNQKRIETLAAEVADLKVKIKQGDKLERDQQTQQQRLAKAKARLADIETARRRMAVRRPGRSFS